MNNHQKTLLFVNYNSDRPILYDTNPFCMESKLLPGIYLIGVVVKSDFLPKRFHMRVAGSSGTSITEYRYSQYKFSYFIHLFKFIILYLKVFSEKASQWHISICAKTQRTNQTCSFKMLRLQLHFRQKLHKQRGENILLYMLQHCVQMRNVWKRIG